MGGRWRVGGLVAANKGRVVAADGDVVTFPHYHISSQSSSDLRSHLTCIGAGTGACCLETAKPSMGFHATQRECSRLIRRVVRYRWWDPYLRAHESGTYPRGHPTRKAGAVNESSHLRFGALMLCVPLLIIAPGMVGCLDATIVSTAFLTVPPGC